MTNTCNTEGVAKLSSDELATVVGHHRARVALLAEELLEDRDDTFTRRFDGTKGDEAARVHVDDADEPHRHQAQDPDERQVDAPTQHAFRHDDGARAFPSHGLQLGDIVSSSPENRTNGGGAQRNALHAGQERRQATNAEVRAVDVEPKHGPLHGARGAVVATATCGPWVRTTSSETAQHAARRWRHLMRALSSRRLVDCTR